MALFQGDTQVLWRREASLISNALPGRAKQRSSREIWLQGKWQACVGAGWILVCSLGVSACDWSSPTCLDPDRLREPGCPVGRVTQTHTRTRTCLSRQARACGAGPVILHQVISLGPLVPWMLPWWGSLNEVVRGRLHMSLLSVWNLGCFFLNTLFF